MTSTKPLVSIIVPAYNHERYVQECIYSLVEQTYANIELIILNDGSTDKTHNKIEEIRHACENRFVRFVYVDKKNEGVTKTLNQGIMLAAGDFVLTLASDDKACDRDAVTCLINSFCEQSAQTPNLAVICGDMSIMDTKGRTAYWTDDRKLTYEHRPGVTFEFTTAFFTHWRKGFDGFNYLGEEFGSYQSLLVGHYMPNGCLIKRALLVQAGLYTEDVCIEDWDMWLKLSKLYSFKFIPKPLFTCRWHDSNAQILKERQIRRDIYKVIIREREYCQHNSMQSSWTTAYRLSRSGLISCRDFSFLLKNTAKQDFYFIVGDVLTFLMHNIKPLLKHILPVKYFGLIKKMGRMAIK